jgi:LPS-assembly lipoprotein
VYFHSTFDIRHSAFAVALCATACGFHFAGTRQLPSELSWVYIDVVTPYRVSRPPLEQALRTRLTRRGGVVSGSAGGARTVLRLSELTETREVLSVDTFGKAVEYKLTTRVRYELLEDGRPLLAPDVMLVSRDYSFNAQQVLAKEAEEARLQTFIQDELAELLLLRLEAQVSRRAVAPAVPPAPKPES